PDVTTLNKIVGTTWSRIASLQSSPVLTGFRTSNVIETGIIGLMSTANAALLETISKTQLRGLPSRRALAAERLNKIKELASALVTEAESLDHEDALAETSATVENLTLKSGLNFMDEVRKFEMRLINRALELTGGN